MIDVAVLGFGVVGSGTVKLLHDNAGSIRRRCGEEIRVKKILDLRDFPESPYASLITHDFAEIEKDPSITIAAEAIGGIHPALEFSLALLRAGKSVVTSNKELVAAHGTELLAEAEKHGCFYCFEASVGGGIPVIRPLKEDLGGTNAIERIDGILNGTTNYILTEMKEKGVSFEKALRQAQENGYAEADPTADIEGIDACRKIAILYAVAFGRMPDASAIPTEGITHLREQDGVFAERLGYAIKLIATARRAGEGKFSAAVRPCFVPREHPLYPVSGVFNGVLVKGNYVGDVMFYGRGAGAEPTASAVAGDIVNVAEAGKGNRFSWTDAAKGEMLPPSLFPHRYYLAFSGATVDAGIPAERSCTADGETAVITPPLARDGLAALRAEILTRGGNILSTLEVL